MKHIYACFARPFGFFQSISVLLLLFSMPLQIDAETTKQLMQGAVLLTVVNKLPDLHFNLVVSLSCR